MNRALSQVCGFAIVVLTTWICIPLFGGIVMQLSNSLPPALNPFPKDDMQALLLGGVIGFLVGAVGTSAWVIRTSRTREKEMEAGASNNDLHPLDEPAPCAAPPKG